MPKKKASRPSLPNLTRDAELKRLEEMADDILKADRINAKAAKQEEVEKVKLTEPYRSLATPEFETNQVQSTARGHFNLKGVVEVLLDHGFNPAEKILEVMPQLEPDVQAKFSAELLKYVQPQLKSVELSGKGGRPIEFAMAPDERQARIDALLAKLENK